jgi:FAD/FMN-containing dehydrogenase/Fe-S oxidoreductase
MASSAVTAESTDLVEELRRLVDGEVRFDDVTRALYSTDASIYRIEPIGVVLPRTADDVIAVVETAARHGVPVLPRGGGTSLAGQTVGHAVVMDFSKYMRHVIEVNAEERWVRTQPGIILDELNRHLEPHGLHFAPDPSTSNRGNVGGALGNNSCGAHSIMYGKTVDNVIGLETVLSNGDRATLGRVDRSSLDARLRAGGLEGDIFRALRSIGEETGDEVLSRYPNIQRRVSGYNLDELENGGPFDMARFVVGSEGTLLTITEAKLALVTTPAYKRLAVLHFNSVAESMEATVAVLDLAPAAVELIDSMIVRQAAANLEYSRQMGFVQGDPEALLLVEVVGDSDAEVESKLDALDAKGLGYATTRVADPQEQASVWAVRKAGLGLMMNVAGPAKPLPFVEDTAVAPERLPEYVRRFDEIVRAHGTTAGYYGHASVGCLHIRPLIDLKSVDGVERMESITSQISDLVLEFGGAMSGEHGDGLARSALNEKMFGPVIYNAFRRVKGAFDPQGIMNPGKIVDAPPMTENLKIGPDYKTLGLATGFAFSQEGGFAAAVEMCNGQGACRKIDGGTMCPSFMVTRDEEHSTRGRANALRAAISGALPLNAIGSERLHDVMDLCLGCKGCKAECPSNVDMAKLKYEFLDRYHKTNGYGLRERMFGNIARLGKLGSMFAPFSNWALRSDGIKDLLERYAGVDRRRDLPPFASQTFAQWFRARGGSPETARGEVMLFADTFTNYNHPELGRAAVKVLENLGYQVVIPPTGCCGRPMMSAGMLDKAKSAARHNIDQVLPYIDRGVKLVGIEPSCILSFSDEYPDLLGDDAAAKRVAQSVMLIEEFVEYAAENDGAHLDFTKPPGKVLYHGHCHQKALVGSKTAMSVLKAIPGCDPEEVPSGCCGMAGSFGFEKEHYDISMQIGEQSLFGPIRDLDDDVQVVSEGISCRQQIADGTNRRAKHLVEILAEALS